MFKIISILLSLLILNSCYSKKIVGKKILCLRLDNQFKFEDMRAYDFISENTLIRIPMWFEDPIDSYVNDLSGEKWTYKLKSETIEVYLSQNKISEIINRKDLSISMPWDKNWNYAEGECKIFKGEIREEMKRIHKNKNREHEINLFDRINNFFDKILYKI